MKIKISAIALIIIFLISSIIVTGEFENITKNDIGNNCQEINKNIAILSSTPIGWDKNAATYYSPILNNYSWTVGNRTYKFILTPITDEKIINGELNVDNFDALLVPGGGVGDEESITKGTLPNIRPNVIKWREGIANFIKSGGGYVAYCGGTLMLCDIDKIPETKLEINYKKCNIGVSEILCHYDNVANYFSAQFRKDGYKLIGEGNYMLWSAYVDHDLGWPKYNGVCFDVQINNSNPIYDDYLEKTCRARWIGGPSYVIPENTKSSCSVGARYPNEGLVDNESMRIHYWKYTGGIIGYLKGLFRAFKWCKEHNLSISESLVASIEFASDWERTDEYVDINQSNKPCFVSEIYPNENKARIALSAFHVARNVWWGGHIEEDQDTDDNYIADNFYELKDYTPFNETPEDEMTHTWWIVRREIAWAAKVPDNDLPPVYGPSQVCDFEENPTSLNFKVYGVSEETKGNISLDLYYRHSVDNENWTEWTLFNSDVNKSDGWSWDFNSPNGIGYYQFYSIRNVESEGKIDMIPPGPDASVFVEYH